MASLLQVRQSYPESNAKLLRRLFQLAALSHVKLTQSVDDVMWCLPGSRHFANLHPIYIYNHLDRQQIVIRDAMSSGRNMTVAQLCTLAYLDGQGPHPTTIVQPNAYDCRLQNQCRVHYSRKGFDDCQQSRSL